MDIEIFWGEGQIDLEKKGERRTVEALPGSRVVEQLPLPAPGTLVRAAARALAGRAEGQRSLIMALEAQAPLIPPRELGAWLREKGVVLTWKGAIPRPVEPPAIATPGSLFEDSSSRRRPGGERAPRDPGAERPPRPRDAPAEASSEPGGEGDTPPDAEPASPASPSTDEPAAEMSGDAEDAAGTEETQDTEDTEDADEADDTEQSLPPSHGFRVYRRVAGGQWGVPLNYQPQDRRIFTDTAAPLGQTVCYVVRAAGSIDPLIESAPSNEVCLEVRDVIPPSPPSGLAVVPREGALEVVWSPSSDAGLAGYRVYRWEGEAEPELVAEIPAGTTTWLDDTGRGGVLYRYTVTAVDAAGNEGPTSGAAEGIRP
jgi:hypothetical protein